MNQLSTSKRTAVIAAPVEGASINATLPYDRRRETDRSKTPT
jgi:hypothetical protein